MPDRLEQLQRWLRRVSGIDELDLEPASGDASFRRYFRVRLGGDSFVAMDAPPDREDSSRFVDVARRLEAVGVRVPRIYEADLSLGFLLIEDLGTAPYLDRLSEATADGLYGDALDALMTIQARAPREGLPCYDRSLLERELEIFREWLVRGYLGLKPGPEQERMLDDAFERLVENALDQPRVCVHRDYHSRNLMVTDPPTPGILDFQDAVIGPVAYDPVSLLKDCYIRWPRERVRDWAREYFGRAVQSGVLGREHERLFPRWLDLTGAQRHLKAAGIFARLHLRDGKDAYLADIPRTLGYVVELAHDYPELADLARLIEERVLPRL